MEHAHRFGSDNNLVGIVNVPDKAREGRPAVIFINGGLLHRVGPYRLYTETAREFEALGYHVLRFDLSGLGDSATIAYKGEFTEQTQRDITATVDFMQASHGCDTIVLAGLCSGADDALDAALADDRINGLLLLDGAGFRTRRFHVHRAIHHYGRRVFRQQRWARLANRICRRAGIPMREQKHVEIREANESLRNTRSAAELREAVQTLALRGVKQHFLFTGGVFSYYNYRGQLFDMFKGLNLNGQVSESFHTECDHMFLLHRHRHAVLKDMVRWTTQTQMATGTGQ